MRYKTILDHGRVQVIDTVRPITRAIIGQHDEAADRPESFQKDPEKDKLTLEQQKANSEHRLRLNSGYYNMTVLDWLENDPVSVDQWAAYINVRVLPATRAANG